MFVIAVHKHCAIYFKGIIMAKAIIQNTSINYKQGAYKQAQAGDVITSFASDVLSANPAYRIDKSLPETVMADIIDGYRQRWDEINPPCEYAVIDGNYIKINEENLAKFPKIKEAKEKNIIGMAFAFSYSQQKIGELKASNKGLYEVLIDIRNRVSDYCSNKRRALFAQMNSLVAGKRERGATGSFNDRVLSTMDDLKAKCKTAKSRGDTTADDAKLLSAINAFSNIWNK